MKVSFKGNGLEFTVEQLGLTILTLCTFGILFPYQVFRAVRFFIEHIEIDKPYVKYLQDGQMEIQIDGKVYILKAK